MKMEAWTAPIPREWRNCLTKGLKKIFFYEILAVPIALLTWEQQISGSEVILFIDNDGSSTVLGKGSSRNPDANPAIGWFWFQCARLRISPWLMRVPSGVNPADSLSHNDLRLAQLLGWELIDPVLPASSLLRNFRMGSLATLYSGALVDLGVSTRDFDSFAAPIPLRA